jgi:RNA polymerase sigma-70 factor (ECF subfamily)
MVNFRRMDVRRKAANALVFGEERLDVSDEKPDPGELLSRLDEATALRGAVLRLPEDLRLVVVMHYFNGFSVPEIAKTVQSPEGTVYYRLHEARQRIREYLSKVFDTPGIKSSEGARQ